MKKTTAACVLMAMLSACSSDETALQVSSTEQAGDISSAETSQASSAGNRAQPSTAALSDARINYAAALGRVEAVIAEPGPCPFLSDDTAKSTVKSRFEIERREVSNTACRWSYNAGFSIKATVEPLDQSTPVAQRRYNIGVEAQLDAQSGPGNNAALLSDTAFGKALPFGYGFELDDNAVFIHVTGFKTDAARLRATADEIAARLPSAPTIEPQRRSESTVFEPCSVWQATTLNAVLGLSERQPLSSRPSGNSCIYEAYAEGDHKGIQLTLRFGELDPKYHAKAVARGAKDVSGFDFPVSAAIEQSDFGTYTKLTGYVEGGGIEILLLDKGNAEHTAIAQTLLRNIAARI